MDFIPYGRQSITEDDINSVIKILKSDYLTQGPVVPLFEEKVRNYCKSEYAIAVNSATSALHLACLALGVGKGDIVWTTPITFVASANCALYCLATIDFVDIDPLSHNMSVEKLSKKLELAEKNNMLPKVVIPVHLCGHSCDMEGISRLAKRYNFKIIEDASHAIGGKYKAHTIGSCIYSDITVFSFHPVKIITTAEGGMAVTNSQELSDKMVLLRSHGITRDQRNMTKKTEGDWYYQQIELGYNYRMTELQAALGVSQMKRLDEFVLQRNEKARVYNRKFEKLPLTLPLIDENCFSAFHLYVIRINQDDIGQTRNEVFQKLRDYGIGVNVHYIPVYSQPYFKNMGFKSTDYKESENYYKSAISIPLYPSIKEEEQQYVCKMIKKTLEV